MYDFQQEPNLDDLPTMGEWFDGCDEAYFHSDLARALTSNSAAV